MIRRQPDKVYLPNSKLVPALRRVIDEQDFTRLRKQTMKRHITKLAKKGKLRMQDVDAEWLYRICVSGLMQHEFHWIGWELRSPIIKRYTMDPDCLPFDMWDGSRARVLLLAEQGIGDEIVFSSCYHELAEDVEEAWIECDPRLIGLFERSFPPNLHFVTRFLNDERRIVKRVVDQQKIYSHLPIDAYIPIGNVPKLYRQSVDDFPKKRRGWLKVDESRRKKWAWHQPMLGCSWRGRQGEIEQVSGAVSLQYSTDDHGKCHVPGIDLTNDIDGVAALIASLEAGVLTTTNAVAHIAGAIGVMTDVVRPPPIYATKEDGFNNRVTPWWPYDYSDWYPNITIFRNMKEWYGRRWNNVRRGEVRR